MLTDTHAHLASGQFSGDLAEVIERARGAGVGRIVCVGTNLEDGARALEIAAAHEGVFATVGVHPCDADTVRGEAFVGELRRLAAHPKVAAVGEIGLDHYHKPPEGWEPAAWRAHQAFVLDRQLELAAELGLNVVLHNRESFADLRARVLPFSGRLRAVFHCFTGGAEDARLLLEAGHLVSFTGVVTFRNAQVVQATARSVPEGGFMLETDCPYLAPVPHRGQRNEPAHVAHTAAFIADLRGMSVEDLARRTTATAGEFFRFSQARPASPALP